MSELASEVAPAAAEPAGPTGPVNPAEIAAEYGARADAIHALPDDAERVEDTELGEQYSDFFDGLEDEDGFEDAGLHPFDPANPDLADNLKGALAEESQALEELLDELAVTTGIDRDELAMTIASNRAEWRMQQEAEQQFGAAQAELGAREFLATVAPEVGSFDENKALDLGRGAYAAAVETWGPDVAAGLAGEILRESAKVAHKQQVETFEKGLELTQIGAHLAGNPAAYDGALALAVTAEALPYFRDSHGGDEIAATMGALDLGSHVAAAAAGNGKPPSGYQTATYYGARAKQLRQLEANNPDQHLERINAEAKSAVPKDPRNIGVDLVRKYAQKGPRR